MHSHAKSESYGSLPKKKHHISMTMGAAKKRLEIANGMSATNTDTMKTQNVKSAPMMKYIATNPSV